MNEITVFNNNGFGRVREININGEPWFVGKDIAEALGYENINKAVQMHVYDEDKKVLDFKGFSQNGTTQNLWSGNDFSNKTIINESGMYALIFGSKLESAKRFKHWVTDDVLPSIRKTGSYSINKNEHGVNSHLLEVINLQQKEITDLTDKINDLTKNLSAPRESVQVSQIAYMLQNKGVNVGRNRLIKVLRDKGYLTKNKNRVNVASKRSLDEGLMELRKKNVYIRGNNFTNIQTFVTPKGQDFFFKMFNK